MSFKSQRELYLALIEGNTLENPSRFKRNRLSMNLEGKVLWDDGITSYESFTDHKDWQIYEPPKEKKTVTLYRYTFGREGVSGSLYQTDWSTQTFNEIFDMNIKPRLFFTETKTIEITL